MPTPSSVSGRRKPKPHKDPHLLDARAKAVVAASDGDADDLLSIEDVARWFQVSMQWVDLARYKGYGPPYVLVTPRIVRYRRSEVIAWLKARTYRSPAEYKHSRGGRAKS